MSNAKWHWIYKNPEDLPKYNEPVICIMWNGFTNSSECRTWYTIGHQTQIGYKIKWDVEGDYEEVVAWTEIEAPENFWDNLMNHKEKCNE